MSITELKKEAEVYADDKKHFDGQPQLYVYLAGAEPREKQIEELEQKLEDTEKDLADYQFNYPTIKELEQEKRLLGERCNQLLKDKGDLTDKLDSLTQYNNELCDSVEKQSFEICTLENKIMKLEQQIEKMKVGGNCKHEYWINTGGCYDQKCRFTGLDCTNCKDKWEIKESD